jgi:plastocyanin
MRIRTTLLTTLAVLALAGSALAACGSDDDNSGSSGSSGGGSSGGAYSGGMTKTTSHSNGGEKLAVDAVEQGPSQFAFSKKALKADAGSVTVAMTNPTGNQFPHAIEIEGQGIEKEGDTVTAGGTSTVTADLKPGKYTFYCPVDSHREDGMQGTLTVK